MLCYTDGLVERRDEEIETGVKRLAGACCELGRDDDLFTWLADVVLAVRDTSARRRRRGPRGAPRQPTRDPPSTSARGVAFG